MKNRATSYHRGIGILLIFAMIFTTMTTFTVSADVLDDLDAVPFIPASVPRKNVVVNAVKTDVPPQFANDVIRTYPDGKMKAFLMSWDDGGQDGYGICDRNLLLPLFRANGLVAAFMINQKTAQVPAGVRLGYVDASLPLANRVSVYSGRTDNGDWGRSMAAQYEGMELANHGRDHMTNQNLSKNDLRWQAGEYKNTMEQGIGAEVAGYAKAGGTNEAYANTAPLAWHDAYLKYVGHRYVRLAPTKNPGTAGTASALNYDVPSDFYNWNPTIKIVRDVEVSSTRTQIMQYFLDTDFGNNLKLFYGWGHGWEMASGSDKAVPTAAFDGLKSMCELAGANLNILWNPTPIDYTDYINATWNMNFSAGENGDIVIHNPSGAVAVWQKVHGQLITVQPGTIVTVDTTGAITKTEKGETVTNNQPGGYVDGKEFISKELAVQALDSVNVTVEGICPAGSIGAPVTLIVVPSTANVSALTDSDIKYIGETVADASGGYSFTFPLDDVQIDGARQCTNYKVLVNRNGNDITQTISKADFVASPIRAAVDVSVADSVATVQTKIDNMSKTQGRLYTLILCSYGDQGQLLGIKRSDTKAIQSGLIGYQISDVVPAGTTKVKGFIWDSTAGAIPLAVVSEDTP